MTTIIYITFVIIVIIFVTANYTFIGIDFKRSFRTLSYPCSASITGSITLYSIYIFVKKFRKP